jgi:hypothetical protein
MAAMSEPPVDLAAVLTGIAGDPRRTGEEIVSRAISVRENRPDIRERMARHAPDSAIP